VTSSIICHLILKDWRLNRLMILLSVAIGLGALVLVQVGGQAVRLFGTVWFFVCLCILAAMLPSSAILNERKKQTLAFMMSLPVSTVQYTIAKVLSILAMFLVPWLTLLISALLLIEAREVVPHGVIPMLIILALLPLIAFCVISAAALVGESEGWLMAASILCNSSYWFVYYLLARIPHLTAGWAGPVAVWNPTTLIVVSGELGTIFLIAAVTFFFQSRKRDFV